jgi:hypothetical protein
MFWRHSPELESVPADTDGLLFEGTQDRELVLPAAPSYTTQPANKMATLNSRRPRRLIRPLLNG